MGPFRSLALTLRAALFVTPWLLHLTVADVALSLCLPLSLLAPSLSYSLASLIAASVWAAIQSIFTRLNRAHIIVSGTDALPRGESAIVVSNHVAWADFYLIQALALQQGMLGSCRWFAKKQLKWVPFLGWGLWAMGMPLVSRKWAADHHEMERVFHGIVRRQWPVWLISYSEATRYTAAKRREAEQWCRENNKHLGQHVLYPRTKGFVACTQKLRATPHVRAVYDVTIAYAKGNKLFQSPPSFWDTLSQPRLDQQWKFYVHVDRYDVKTLPSDDEQLAAWLEARWVQKGKRLDVLRDRLARQLPWDSGVDDHLT